MQTFVLGCMDEFGSEMLIMACCWVAAAMDRALVLRSERVRRDTMKFQRNHIVSVGDDNCMILPSWTGVQCFGRSFTVNPE
jgi:hypothetical protein